MLWVHSEFSILWYALVVVTDLLFNGIFQTVPKLEVAVLSFGAVSPLSTPSAPMARSPTTPRGLLGQCVEGLFQGLSSRREDRRLCDVSAKIGEDRMILNF